MLTVGRSQHDGAGLPLADEYGGFGGGAIDIMGVMEIFGEALVVEPYLATVLALLFVAHTALGCPDPPNAGGRRRPGPGSDAG